MNKRNLLRCPKCGFAVYSGSSKRDCAKCDTPMIYICKEGEPEDE